MSDKTTEEKAVEGAATSTSAYPKPKKGQDDSGHIVSGAADEPFSGTLADITDGDNLHKKKKHK